MGIDGWSFIVRLHVHHLLLACFCSHTSLATCHKNPTHFSSYRIWISLRKSATVTSVRLRLENLVSVKMQILLCCTMVVIWTVLATSRVYICFWIWIMYTSTSYRLLDLYLLTTVTFEGVLVGVVGVGSRRFNYQLGWSLVDDATERRIFGRFKSTDLLQINWGFSVRISPIMSSFSCWNKPNSVLINFANIHWRRIVVSCCGLIRLLCRGNNFLNFCRRGFTCGVFVIFTPRFLLI